MKTIFMFCRSESETPDGLVRLMKDLFPECEVHLVYESALNSSLRDGNPSPLAELKEF